ncbi:nickel-responsive transcriptional regulator NikR [Paenibacillaceae bacterium WGS1546]|uniref:nickel-responsive transcriptional regulator NikR n=1 Tax=Cohnella sp. WGS1546 TaxID=3366810 RepID=UPI00372D6A8D
MTDKGELVRFGVSFPETLIDQFDNYIAEQGYTNRSEAFRDLARKALLEPSRLSPESVFAGTIVLVYDHHVQELPTSLTEIQHRFHHEVISTMHVHLNHAQCLEVVVVRGRLAELRALHQRIQVQKGVLYAELSVTHADERPDAAHAHD